MGVVKLRSAEIQLVDEGTGEPLVFVHGVPGRLGEAAELTAKLRDQFRCIRVDMPGFGGSPPMQSHALQARAEVVGDLIDELRLDRPTIVGHSYGAIVGVALAACLPDKLGALALIAPPGPSPHQAVKGPYGFYSFLLRSRLLRGMLSSTLRKGFEAAGLGGYTDAELVESVRAVAELSFDDYRRHLSAISVPLFWAKCDDDELVESERHEELAAMVGEPTKSWSEGGHYPQRTHVAELADALRDFVTAARTYS